MAELSERSGVSTAPIKDCTYYLREAAASGGA